MNLKRIILFSIFVALIAFAGVSYWELTKVTSATTRLIAGTPFGKAPITMAALSMARHWRRLSTAALPYREAFRTRSNGRKSTK
jgi:hypothetical protein